MGNTCASIKRPKNSGERKASAESIPYGEVIAASSSTDTAKAQPSDVPQTSVINPSETITASVTTASTVSRSISSTTAIKSSHTTSTISPLTSTINQTTANAQNFKNDQSPRPHSSSEILGTSSTAKMIGTSPDPISLSPIPTASTPSPYSMSRYSSTSGPDGMLASYQNISPIIGHISLNQYQESIRASSFTQIFHLKYDLNKDQSNNDGPTIEDFYLITLSTESDEIVIWNIYQQKAERILKGIPKPRNVQMVDQLKTVVLCNRELMLYDLNRAKLITKLKGVMNQKMPYYGLHNDKYVVALSRNRMYVNMINLDTGDLETTFKAGEDRFLNSLLTSANGKICVCGDETQKPFPLLVWDLSNRKLLYDLRIPHHEFITKLSAISDDGHYVVSVCQECNTISTNFLIVYDLQSGTLFKKWKPDHDSVSVAISTQCGGCVINGIKNNDVLVWDLSTGNIKYTLTGHTAPPDLLSSAPKSNINNLEFGKCLWTYTPEKDISCCALIPNGMAIVYGFVGEKQLHLAFREDENKTEEENREFIDNYIEEMCSKLIPYGDKELSGCTFDLSST
ncbi:hypothetical protein QR98_0041170 [Sarcoptes scabiei]|uniref:Uncharacterized protein n=1 Tax=Sarcoptes scabiei TaxID=52283 RepID=A0A132A3W8_SARSC|nr:hypothetical protein QR98_0041170 [Sarcoptes scabiei]